MNKLIYIGVLIATLGYSSITLGQTKESARPPEKVVVSKVTTGLNTIKRIYVGQAEATRKVTVIPRVNGYIDSAPFQEGSIVQKGDILFEIEKTRYQATVKSIEAKLQQLDAEIAYAENSLKRQKKVLEKNAISKDEVESSRSTLDKLLAQKSGIEAELVIAKEDLKYCTIRAPFQGRVGRIAHPEGQYITTNDTLVTITEEMPIYVKFTMSESDLLNIYGDVNKLKELAEIRVYTANEQIFEEKGIITITDNEVDPTTDTLKVWATFNNEKNILQPGSILTVHMNHKESHKVPVVPLTAVLHDADGAFVYTVSPEKKIVRKNIIAGEINGYNQAIYKGLDIGESVIIDGTHKIKPGMVVEPMMKNDQK